MATWAGLGWLARSDGHCVVLRKKTCRCALRGAEHAQMVPTVEGKELRRVALGQQEVSLARGPLELVTQRSIRAAFFSGAGPGSLLIGQPNHTLASVSVVTENVAAPSLTKAQCRSVEGAGSLFVLRVARERTTGGCRGGCGSFFFFFEKQAHAPLEAV